MNEKEMIELQNYMKETAPDAKCYMMNPKEVIFEENVRMNCFYCGKYNNNWRCPPNLPEIDYKKMFEEFDEGMFVAYTFDISDSQRYQLIRTESTVKVHKTLLDLEKWMWQHNRSTALSFGAGSCKLCKGGCGKDKCNNPYMSRSPIEATGINVLKTAKKFGLDIRFPADSQLLRVGLIIWQNPTE